MTSSASPDLIANAETWLDFTDLVFIDPAGTGYSRALASTPDARRRLWSVEGDIEYLAEAIRRWVDRFDRNVSPKYLLGESYAASGCLGWHANLPPTRAPASPAW